MKGIYFALFLLYIGIAVCALVFAAAAAFGDVVLYAGGACAFLLVAVLIWAAIRSARLERQARSYDDPAHFI
jgi:hypothetical protein